jgi:hypothetical protein
VVTFRLIQSVVKGIREKYLKDMEALYKGEKGNVGWFPQTYNMYI